MKGSRIRHIGIQTAIAAIALAGNASATQPNVKVSVKDGKLRLAGTDAAERFRIAQPSLQPGDYSIEPIGDTLIDGKPAPLVVTGIMGEVRIHLGDGDDVLRVQDVAFPATVKIDLDHGDNELTFSGTTPEDVYIRAHGGDDRVVISDSDVADDLSVSLGRGDNRDGLVSSTHASELRWSTREGDDDVTLDDVTTDVSVFLYLNQGTNRSTVTNCDTKFLFVYGGASGDTASIRDTSIDAEVEFNLSGGENEVSVDGCAFGGDLRVISYHGKANVERIAIVDTSVADSVFLKLANGKSEIEVHGCTIGSILVLDGKDKTVDVDRITIGNTSVADSVELLLGKAASEVDVHDCPSLNSLRIEGKGGKDSISVSNCGVMNVATVEGGNGMNHVAFTSSTVGDELAITTGKGDDLINITNTSAAKVILDAGSGTNTIVK